MILVDSEEIKNRGKIFFSICFKIKNKHDGKTTEENAKQIIGSEFGLVSDGTAVQRYFEEMIMAKFFTIGVNGIIINSNIDAEYDRFKKQFKIEE